MTDNTFLYKSIISSMSEGLIVISMKGKITHCNEAAYKLLNIKEEDFIDQNIIKFFLKYQENDDFNQAILDAVYDQSKRHNTIVSYFDGQNRKQFNITTFYLNENNEKIGIVIVINDISELAELRDAVKAMEQIKKLNNQLELRNQLLSQTFGRFLSDEIVKELLDTPEGLQVGGKKRDVTIMMCDLRGFTAICESIPPKSVIDLLNNYITVMADIISKYHGTIIEILGDGLLVVFGAPMETDLHAQNAVAAAIEMQMQIPNINEWNKSHKYPLLQMGIGISSGETIVGNIGSFRHTKYGVIGKYVNLCGRIEACSTGGQILIAPSTKSQIKEPLEISNEFEILPKGLKNPITISEISGIGGSINLHLNKQEISLTPCKKPLEVIFSEIKDKIVNKDDTNKGKIVAASKNNAILITSKNLEKLTNLEIFVKPTVYGKVLYPVASGYMIAFTSDPSSLISELEF